ncbi:MAG: SulP family inorganic anion transporter [Ilumatobacteraceae bacterium]
MERLSRLVPAVAQARAYRREWWSRDVGAGIVLTGLLAPAGMAYAAAAGLPPVNGLYATIVASLTYALFGPSRVLVIGPDSAIAPLIAAAVVPMAAGDPATAVALAGALSVMAGVMCLVAGLARFGFVSELLSAPVRYGYLHGIALTIIVAQVAKACGLSATGESLLDEVEAFAGRLRESGVSGWSLAVAAVSLAVVVVARRIDHRLPAALLAVLVGIAMTLVFGLGDVDGVHLVGALPQGLPRPGLPDVDLHTARSLVGAALGIALVSFADTSVLSRTMALRRHEHVDGNQELAALGVVNIATGLFHGFAVSGSNSRTPVAEAAGSRSQLTGVTTAVVLLGVTALVPGLFRNLPDATLAAIVIAAAVSLIDIRAMRRLYLVRRSEFVLALAGLLSVAVLGPVSGVVVAVALSVLNFLRLVWKPHTAELVRVDGLKGYHDRARHPEGRVVPGLLLYRFDAPLFFANSRYFATDLEARVDERERLGDPVRCIVVTAEPITDIDTSAADTLRDLLRDLRRRGVEVRFAEMKGMVREAFDRYGIADGQHVEHTHRTTGEAVHAYVRDYAIDWTDWDER